MYIMWWKDRKRKKEVVWKYQEEKVTFLFPMAFGKLLRDGDKKRKKKKDDVSFFLLLSFWVDDVSTLNFVCVSVCLLNISPRTGSSLLSLLSLSFFFKQFVSFFFFCFHFFFFFSFFFFLLEGDLVGGS